MRKRTVYLTEEEKTPFIEKHAMTTKAKLIQRIERISIETMIDAESEKPIYKSHHYYVQLKEMVHRFLNVVRESKLPDFHNDRWGYTISVTEEGIFLYLSYFDVDYDTLLDTEDHEMVCYPVAVCSYKVLEVLSTMLSPEQYAETYGVGEGTVRQWIRRGKIRSARKIGRVWRIPVLCDRPEHGYLTGTYWPEDQLDNIPEEYSFLHGCTEIVFWTKNEDGNYPVTIDGEDHLETRFLSIQEREKFELFLISHPQIKCKSTIIAEYS